MTLPILMAGPARGLAGGLSGLQKMETTAPSRSDSGSGKPATSVVGTPQGASIQ